MNADELKKLLDELHDIDTCGMGKRCPYESQKQQILSAFDLLEAKKQTYEDLWNEELKKTEILQSRLDRALWLLKEADKRLDHFDEYPCDICAELESHDLGTIEDQPKDDKPVSD